jgi:hypothetical protein
VSAPLVLPLWFFEMRGEPTDPEERWTMVSQYAERCGFDGIHVVVPYPEPVRRTGSADDR